MAPRTLLSLALAALTSVVVSTQSPASPRPALTDVTAFNERAPETFRVLFATSAGSFAIKVNRAWAPHGADRFYNLVKNGFYDECR